jgi:CheY-like chemotaxis protein
MQTSNLTGLNILVVEDDPLLRRQIAATLEKLAADVTCTAAN